MPVPHKMLDYWGLLDAGVIPSTWTQNIFNARRNADPDFPRGVTEGRKLFYDAAEVAAYIEGHWAKLRKQQHGGAASPRRSRPADPGRAAGVRMAAHGGCPGGDDWPAPAGGQPDAGSARRTGRGAAGPTRRLHGAPVIRKPWPTPDEPGPPECCPGCAALRADYAILASLVTILVADAAMRARPKPRKPPPPVRDDDRALLAWIAAERVELGKAFQACVIYDGGDPQP